MFLFSVGMSWNKMTFSFLKYTSLYNTTQVCSLEKLLQFQKGGENCGHDMDSRNLSAPPLALFNLDDFVYIYFPKARETEKYIYRRAAHMKEGKKKKETNFLVFRPFDCCVFVKDTSCRDVNTGATNECTFLIFKFSIFSPRVL